VSGRRHTFAALAAGAALLLPAAAAAHPMGTFSINHYAAITATPESLGVRYLVDFAEVPSTQLLRALDADGDNRVTPAEKDAFLDSLAPVLESNIELRVNGVPVPLARTFRNVHLLEGEGGLSTVVVGLQWAAALADSLRTALILAEYADRNYEGRMGWKEIRIDTRGTTLLRCTVDPGDPTEGLTKYPEEYAGDPPQETEARFYYGEGEPPPTALEERPGKKNALASLIRTGESPRLLAGALLIALLLGAVHALEPGHGKTLVAAYLVGSRGTVPQAVLLGLVVTATHTLSVFVLGALTLYASRSFVPEKVYSWLALLSGLLVLVIGMVLLRGALRLFTGVPPHSHGHPHPHPHHHPHADPGKRPSLASLFALGVTGGLVPCPSALVVLLAAVSLGRIGFGLALIVAFSIGLALVLVAIGTLFVVARPLVERATPGPAAYRWLRLLSAAAITLIGIGMTLRALTA